MVTLSLGLRLSGCSNTGVCDYNLGLPSNSLGSELIIRVRSSGVITHHVLSDILSVTVSLGLR